MRILVRSQYTTPLVERLLGEGYPVYYVYAGIPHGYIVFAGVPDDHLLAVLKEMDVPHHIEGQKND